MKKLLIAFLIFLPLASYAQLGVDGKTDQVQRDEPASASTSPKAPVRHYILYSANFPYGEIGLKYGFTYKWFGISASGAISVEYGEFGYITGDLLFKTSNNNCLYVGAGVGPYIYYDSYYDYDEFYMDDFVLEGGTLMTFGHATIDIGLGYNIYMEELYYKLGLGVNF